MSIKFTYEGQEYEFTGNVSHARQGEALLDASGNVVQWELSDKTADRYPIVTPVRKEYTQGGVVFQETGHLDYPQQEWALNDGERPFFFHYWTPTQYRILKPVRIVGD